MISKKVLQTQKKSIRGGFQKFWCWKGLWFTLSISKSEKAREAVRVEGGVLYISFLRGNSLKRKKNGIKKTGGRIAMRALSYSGYSQRLTRSAQKWAEEKPWVGMGCKKKRNVTQRKGGEQSEDISPGENGVTSVINPHLKKGAGEKKKGKVGEGG